MSSVACRVCLRTNVPTLDLPDQLETFHDELCDLETVKHKRLKYCASCAHQVKKCYKFKGLCQRANGLLKLWMKHDDKEISEYRKDLPAESLQITNNSNSVLYECNHDEKTFHNTNVISDCKRNLILKLDSSALAPDDRRHPESSKHSLNSNPSAPDRPRPDLRSAVVRRSSSLGPVLNSNPSAPDRPRPDLRSAVVRRSSGLGPVLNSNPSAPDQPRPDLRPAVVRPSSGVGSVLRPNIGSKPSLRIVKKCGLRPSFRPNFGIRSDLRPSLKTEHVKAKNGILTIDPNLLSVQSRPVVRPNLGLKPAFRPNLSLKPVLKPNLSQTSLIKPNPGLGLSIEPLTAGHKQPKQADLTLDPDFDVSYETDPLSVVNDESAMVIHENTIDIIENESVVEIEKQEEWLDDNTLDVDDAIASVVEIEQKQEDNNECTIPKNDELYDNDSMDSTIDKEEWINNEIGTNDNDTDDDIDSDEYTYEYLEQDIDLLDFVTKQKQKEPSDSTSIEKKQAEKTTEKELQVKIFETEDVSNKAVLQPAQNEGLPLEDKSKGITKKYAKKAKVDLDPDLAYAYRTAGFKAVPTFKDKMFGLFDESPFVLDDEKVLTKELFSVIYDKLNVREVKRLAIIVLEDDFRAKLTAFLGVLLRKYNPEYESVFHVEFLHTEEEKKEEFKRRELHPDYIRAAYKCTVCYKTYTGQSFLDYHKKMYHDPANPVICSICSYSMPTRLRLMKHRIQAHQVAYSCKLCPLRTNLVTVMRNHYSSHKGFQYQCPICFKICYNENTLRNHKRRWHATHVCTTCAQQYTTEKGLRYHRDTRHKDAPPAEPSQAVPCADCDITFDTRHSYLRHRVIGHSSRSDDDCGVPLRKRVKPPPTASASANDKNEHDQDNRTKKQTKEKTKRRVYRTCEICHENVYVFKFSGSLYKHFLDKHPDVPYHASGNSGMASKDFLCDECGKSFACRSSLRDHKNCHTGLRPYPCELCPARFHTKAHLWAHRSKHQNLRNHCCKVCGKRYKNSTHLGTHMKIHIGDRCFKCSICDKDFLHKCSLKEHIEGVHYKQRRVKKKVKKPAQEI